MTVTFSKARKLPIPHACNASRIWDWKHNSCTWTQRESLKQECLTKDQVEHALSLEKADVMVILASADGIRECPSCRWAFSKEFNMPDLWWTEYCRNSNGYFGTKTTIGNGHEERISTWFRFLIKQVLSDAKYKWLKLNIYTHWRSSSRKSAAIIIFDAPREIETRFPKKALETLNSEQITDPYWFHPYIVEHLVQLQDKAVWGARTQIRNVEILRTPATTPKPDYISLHELARHSIHISETLDLAINTTDDMLSHHEERKNYPNAANHRDIHEKLQFFRHMLKSLRLRSMSNTERLKNEIQLAYNRVAQYDAGLSLQINRAAKSDSAAMKTLAFITAAFLPATFISALFSMSFFNFQPDSGWNVSDRIWIYWAFAAPATIATVGLWHYWQRKESRTAAA